MSRARSSDFFSPLRLHRPSTKGKAPVRDDDIYDSPVSDRNSLSLETGSLSNTIPRPRSASGVLSSANTPKRRGSLLIAASDALGFRFGRKRPSTPVGLPPNTAILPDIIEITAHPPDRESEERERLREEAAQLLGIAVDQDTRSICLTTEDHELDPDALACHVSSSDNATRSTYTRSDMMNRSSNSLPSPTRPTTFTSRRSGSVMTHNRKASNPPPSIPPFPSSVDALQDFKQLSATFPKYYAPTSLRIFALSKQWKLRHIVLTSPLTLITSGSEPAVSYLHVFKSSSAGEFETERLEINEDSVIFIAEEDVGGRKHVVKVGGRGEGSIKGGQTVEEGGRTMWLLQICDTAESQKWISTIKNIILGQRYTPTHRCAFDIDQVSRTIRAGLALPAHTLGGPEPRGDMDVMLSIRQQGIVMAPAALRQSTSSPQSLIVDGAYASSISSQSLKSQGTGPRTPTSSASVFKSFFSSRPRATSRATSFDSEREYESYPNMNHMLSKLRPGTADSKKSSEKSFVPPLSSFASNFCTLQRRIVREQAVGISSDNNERTCPVMLDRVNRASAHGAMSLQPPPRKRRMSGTVTTPGTTTKTDPSGESATGEFSDEPPSCPRFSRFGSPLQRPRVPSVQSVSTIASTDNATSPEQSSISTQRSARRWSRQSTLATRSSPTTGPSPGTLGIHLQPHPLVAEQNIVRTISDHSIDQNAIPGFTHVSSKRTSAASGFSVKSAGTSQSFLISQGRSSRPSSAHRSSMPPSKPAPTSALPPAPGQVSASAPAKPSFRESVAVRVGRLSMVSKTDPITSPEPDEKSIKTHRRASSGSYFLKPAHFNPSTSSLAFVPSHSDMPTPRPIRPLPPTPTSPEAPISTPRAPQPAQWEILRKRGLRILSTPATRSTDDIVSANISNETSRPRSNTVTASIVQASKPPLISQPATPIAEKIMMFQNDITFLQPDTPTISPLSPPRPLPPTPEQLSEMTSLHPPPRRSSRHIIPTETDYDTTAIPIPTPKAPAVEGEHRLISLSRPGSVVSLGIVSM
ncbi:hypothetical protein APHAL10511_002559 [Amanita phalloides]|nr:hypothetical protein APHAL10511_002559 [Amanita phalloides]